jgi:hypothetical protein
LKLRWSKMSDAEWLARFPAIRRVEEVDGVLTDLGDDR